VQSAQTVSQLTLKDAFKIIYTRSGVLRDIPGAKDLETQIRSDLQLSDSERHWAILRRLERFLSDAATKKLRAIKKSAK